MKKILTEESVGKILAYDTTLVTPKDSSTLLKRGHRISQTDVERLKNSGVYEVWIEDNSDGRVYEWDISYRIADTISDGTTEVVKGNHGIAFLTSKEPGLIRVDREGLIKFNLNQQVLVISKSANMPVGRGEVIAAIDVIPLSVTRKEMDQIKKLASRGIVRVVPFKFSKVGLIITGTEIFEKRKADKYYRIVKKKCDKYGWSIIYREIVPDNQEQEIQAIIKARQAGAEGIIVTGGMSVDLTDRTPGTIKSLGANVVAYGIPMKPTTMSIVSTWKNIPLFGISAGGIHYSDFNSIDVMFTRLMAGEVPSKREIAELGVGGIFWNYNAKQKQDSRKKTTKKRDR